ncbi:uncharacterized protein BDZ99DRAFT_464453 [Mytilinidion resinicola]|uniref:Uncharacterized protein n=1 Tax=Mytilinidion resinicola TaxID=574789 RepID=A0A6A6YJ55_9PEZI|nr:uncharacterized protein BDZ99DRAFT_464453 [Mytilinidion resinicola]KAF2808599.1 hypothetical protein BDZ99DRAFT_464453 [Mytilinidion resinicola]
MTRFTHASGPKAAEMGSWERHVKSRENVTRLGSFVEQLSGWGGFLGHESWKGGSSSEWNEGSLHGVGVQPRETWLAMECPGSGLVLSLGDALLDGVGVGDLKAQREVGMCWIMTATYSNHCR